MNTATIRDATLKSAVAPTGKSDSPSHWKPIMAKSPVASSPPVSQQVIGPSRVIQLHATMIGQKLAELPYPDIKELQVHFDGQSVVVSGFLDSYYHKQIVQKHLQSAYQTVDVVDRMVVLPIR